jgi:hypothetical protein
MQSNRERNLQDLLVFFLLVAIGVAGRWAEPTWCFTPTAAASLFAGLYFSRVGIAVLVPISILAISDTLLPAHDNLPVMIATYGIMVVPVWLGRLQRGEKSRSAAAAKWLVFGIAPAVLFYIVTNFAVWAFQSDYTKDLAGLRNCYVAAVPFFRWMLAGDMIYLAALLACLALAGAPQRSAELDAQSASS